MRNAQFFCTQSCSRVKALVKQYNNIKDKQRPVDVVDSQPLKSEMRRLKLLAEIIYADCNIIRALPDKILAIAAEWYEAIAEIEDETARAAANLEYDNCQASTGWEDIGTIHCGYLTLLLDKAHHDADSHAEELAAKVAEAESSDSASKNGGKRNGQANKAGSSSAGGHRPANNAGGFSGGNGPFSGGPTGHFKPNGSDDRTHDFDGLDTDAEQDESGLPDSDPRRSSRFYRGITLPTQDAPADTVRLAAIQLELPPCPVFDGKITEYNTFRDRFINVVEATGRNMTNRDKMAMLLAQLKGKPERICTGFPISDANYWRVPDMLADEYDHQEELEQILLQQLQRLPAPRESRHGLNEFYIDASRILRQLEDMQFDYNTRDVLQSLQSKLPSHILSRVLRAKKPGRVWDTAELLNSLRAEVRHARELGRILQPEALGVEDESQSRLRNEHVETTLGTAAFATHDHSAYYAGGSSSNRNHPANNAGGSGGCAFCDASSHPSARPPPQRSYVAASNKEAATTGDIDSEDECGANPPLSEAEQRALEAALDSDNESDQPGSVRTGYSVLAHQTNGTHGTKLLECTTAHVFNSATGRSEDIVAFFDSGSDTTFVDQELADRLRLPDQGRDVLSVDTFASKGVKINVPIMLTSIGVRLINGASVDLPAKAGSGIIGNIHSALITAEDVPLLRENKCAIIASNERPLLLIGRDEQHLFRKRDDERLLPSGFCLVDTLLGPVLAGKGTVKAVTWASELATSQQSTSTSSAETAPSQQCWSCPVAVDDRKTVSGQQCRDRSAAATFRVIVDEAPALSDAALAKADENYWKTDNIGISLPEPGPEDEHVFRRHCERLTRDEEGRYVTPIPWRTPDGTPVDNDVLRPNYGLALGRLDTILKQQPLEVLQKIGENFRTQETDGIIERVDPREHSSYTTHYLASQVVVKESSNTTKLRVVYDASAGSGRNTKSLNDCTHRGPVLIPNLPGMLMRSRLAAIVLTTDLEKAYLQLGLPPEDRDVCRFLWVKDLDRPLTAANLVVYRFRRVTFGLKSAPFMLAGTLYHHLDQYGTPLAAEIKRNCYVDNVVLAADSVEQALEKYKQTKAIFADAKMNAREFASNSKELLTKLPPEDVSNSIELFHSLGVNWDFADDCWSMPLNCRSTRKPKGKQSKRTLEADALTRRSMSSRLQSIFDPMGLVAPALIAAKLAIQRTYLLESHWDAPVANEIRKLWEAATEDWDRTTIRIPRRVAPCAVRNPEIHIFVDACKDAYGIATYLRVHDATSNCYHTTLVFSRAKVKPAKDVDKLTIPDMELMAMALGARNAPYIIENLVTANNAVYLWSDSMINLQRVVTPWKQKTVWVQNRLEEIRKLKNDHHVQFRHVGTAHNPADIVSRGIPAAELQDNELWWHGAPFLSNPISAWPPQPDVLPLLEGGSEPPTDAGRPANNAGALAGRQRDTLQAQKSGVSATKSATAFQAIHQPPGRTHMPAEPLVDLESTNDYQKMLRRHALVLNAAAVFWRAGLRSPLWQRNKRTQQAFGFNLGERFTDEAFSVDNTNDAELLMFRKAQLRHPPTTDVVRSLGLVLVDEVYRARG